MTRTVANPFVAPEISVQEVQNRIADGQPFVWLDVREPNELAFAAIRDERIVLAPLSELAARQLNALPAEALDQETSIVVLCHHGIRSAQVTLWLLQQGWRNVLNMAGGINAWAKEIDSEVGMY